MRYGRSRESDSTHKHNGDEWNFPNTASGGLHRPRGKQAGNHEILFATNPPLLLHIVGKQAGPMGYTAKRQHPTSTPATSGALWTKCPAGFIMPKGKQAGHNKVLFARTPRYCRTWRASNRI